MNTYVIVFTALVLLYFVFSNIPKLIEWQTNLRLKRKGKGGNENNLDCKQTQKVQLTGGTSAAISVALHMYFNEMHDDEQTVMTIKEVSKKYSPWSSKIYSMNGTTR